MEWFNLIAELGVPIAGALVMAYFIFLVMKQLMDGLVSEIKTIQGITKMLITRASSMNNDMIRIDTKLIEFFGKSLAEVIILEKLLLPPGIFEIDHETMVSQEGAQQLALDVSEEEDNSLSRQASTVRCS